MGLEELDRRLESALREAGLLKQAQGELPPEVTKEVSISETVGETEDKPQAEKKAPPSPTFVNLFQHPDAHPYVLDLALLKKYGPEWMEWEVEVLELRIPSDFPTKSVSDLNLEKLQAMKTLHYVDGFWQSWEVFISCVMPLNGLFPDFEIMQIPTVAQCAVAVDIANRVRDDVAWTDEMKAYLEVVHKFDGIFCAIQPLDFVTIDSEDYPVDCKEVSMLWPAVRKIMKPPTGDTSTAEQLRRLLVVHESLEEHRVHLQSQLPLLLHA